MSAAIFNSGSVKILKDSLKFKSGTRFFVGNDDPTLVPTDGNPPDVYVSTSTNKLYIKQLNDGVSTSWETIIDSFALATELGSYVPLTSVGANNGVASLDAGGKLTASQVPAIAITDTFVVASQAAQTALTAQVGDVAVRTDENKSYILQASPASTFSNWVELLTPTDAVSSVFGRSGTVTAQSGDYTASQVTNTPAGSIAATNVQDAVNELDTDITNHISDAVDAHDASAISNTPSGNLAATDIQAAVNELQTDVDGRATTALGNLATVAINSSLLPATDNSINLGSASKRYTTGYMQEQRDASNALVQSITGRVLYDSSGSSSIDHSSTSVIAVNSKRISSIGDAVDINDAVSKTDLVNAFGNYITLGDATSAVVGVSVDTYNGGTTRPSGSLTGVSTGVTFTRSTSSPLYGTGSLILDKDAANRQGRVAYYSFTLQSGDKAKVMQIEADYIVNSGTFVAGSSSTDSDVIVYIHDVTNNVFIEPSSFKFLSNSTTISDKFIANFQTSATGTSYRLLFYISSTSSAAYSLKFDNIAVKPCKYVYGTPITDWVAYTPTFGAGFGTVSTSAFYSRKVGDSLEVYGKWTNGTVASNTASITVGYAGANANVTIDTAKCGTNAIIGSAQTSLASTTQFAVFPISPASNATTIAFTIQNSTTGFGSGAQLGASISATGSQNSVHFTVPIVGWSSSVQVSDGFEARQINFRAGGTPSGTLAAAFNLATFSTVTVDTTASYSSGTWTAPTSGYYDVAAGIETNQNWTAGNNLGIQIWANGVSIAMNYTQAPRTTNYVLQSKVSANSVYLLSGQTIQIRAYSDGSGGGYTETVSGANFFSVSKASGTMTMSATEVVGANYTGSPPTGTLTNAFNTVTFGTKRDDTHNAYSSGIYTVPVSGFYDISAQTQQNGTYVLGKFALLSLFIDGTEHSRAPAIAAAAIATLTPQLNVKFVKLNAGQLVTIRAYNDGTTPTYGSSAVDNWFSISRVK